MKFEKVKCNICGVDDTVPIGRRKGPSGDSLETNIVRCRRCGLIYPDPMPRFDEKEIQDNFSKGDLYFSGGVNENHIKKYNRFMEMVEGYKPDKGDLLDVGCGRGELVYVANVRGWRACGTEISGDFAQNAREHFNIDVMVGDIDDIDFGPRRFDVVCLNSVIQYVWDPMGTLKKINALLKESGILYMEVTNDDALVFKSGDMFQSVMSGKMTTTRLSPLFPTFQIYGFGKRSLAKALGGSGFEICRMEVKGLRGGGAFKGSAIVKAARKIIIFIGGLTGNGHIIQCVAKKGA